MEAGAGDRPTCGGVLWGKVNVGDRVWFPVWNKGLVNSLAAPPSITPPTHRVSVERALGGQLG